MVISQDGSKMAVLHLYKFSCFFGSLDVAARKIVLYTYIYSLICSTVILWIYETVVRKLHSISETIAPLPYFKLKVSLTFDSMSSTLSSFMYKKLPTNTATTICKRPLRLHVPLILFQEVLQAIFRFEPQSEEELLLFPNDIISVTGKVDANWYEGQVTRDGKICKGIFPKNYTSPYA